MTKRQKIKYVDDLIKKWVPRLYLHEWDIKIQIKSEPCEGYPYRIADCSSSEIYFNAIIRIFPKFWKETSTEQENDIVHELCHCHTEEIDQIAQDLLSGYLRTKSQMHDANERLTQRMANIALGV